MRRSEGETRENSGRPKAKRCGQRGKNEAAKNVLLIKVEAGCTLPEIVSITGHNLQSAARILERNLPRTKAMADVAIVRFENASATQFANRLQTSADCTVEPSKIASENK